jgi:hypothetical protein
MDGAEYCLWDVTLKSDSEFFLGGSVIGTLEPYGMQPQAGDEPPLGQVM